MILFRHPFPIDSNKEYEPMKGRKVKQPGSIPGCFSWFFKFLQNANKPRRLELT